MDPSILMNPPAAAATAVAVAPAASKQVTHGSAPRSRQQPQSDRQREKQPLARGFPPADGGATLSEEAASLPVLRSHGVCWSEGAVDGRRLRIYWAGNGKFFEGTIKASPPWQEKQWDWVAYDDGDMKQHNLVRTHSTDTHTHCATRPTSLTLCPYPMCFPPRVRPTNTLSG